MKRSNQILGLFIVVILLLSGCKASQETLQVSSRPVEPVVQTPPEPAEAVEEEVSVYASVEIGRFDTGKMWTFDNPPIDYLEETYGFRPDSVWFEKVRLGALRLPNCTASFVSPNGLIATNHHCARESVVDVTREGEHLLDDGFYAPSLEEERKVDELYVDQLIEIKDVTDQIYAAATSAADPATARQQKATQLEASMTSEVQAKDSSLTVQIISLYHGGLYSAYTFKRYDDIRLVAAPELKLGGFGGDPDNFTFPRYSLDFSFFRAYNQAGNPLQTQNYFQWSTTGTRPGDAVFVIGNPGSTSRLNTVSQLEYDRDYNIPQILTLLENRASILKAYIAQHRDSVEVYDLRNGLLQIENSVKKYKGELGGLRDPNLMLRRRAAEYRLTKAIVENDSLEQIYGDVIEDIAIVQRFKEASANQAGAFTAYAATIADAHILIRSVYGYIYSLMTQRGLPKDQIEEIYKEAMAVEDWPAEVERSFLASRLTEIKEYLGASDPTVKRILGDKSPEDVAKEIVSTSALIDSTQFIKILESGFLGSDDPTVALSEALTPLYFAFQQQLTGLQNQEEELNAQLAKVRFDIYGTRIPPDATFSLRLADGVVKGYPYNGSIAPTHTTYYGLYNHYYSYGSGNLDWDLPERWIDPPKTFDLSTPLNLVSTNDITGGNSGSPLLNEDLELVGLVFDGNIESLPGTYLFSDIAGRTVSVDALGILEALDEIYDADRIVLELRTGRMVDSEEEADTLGGAQ